MSDKLRKYERTWFDMHGHAQEEVEVFLAYDFKDALAQSEEANRKYGENGRRWVYETRPHDPGPEDPQSTEVSAADFRTLVDMIKNPPEVPAWFVRAVRAAMKDEK